jgi:hypothetical protein
VYSLSNSFFGNYNNGITLNMQFPMTMFSVFLQTENIRAWPSQRPIFKDGPYDVYIPWFSLVNANNPSYESRIVFLGGIINLNSYAMTYG